MKKIPAKIVANLISLFVLAVGISYASIVYGPFFIDLAQHPEQFREYILGYGRQSILVFMLIQAIQVIIAAIPGELTQIAGGYVFGVLGGIVYSSLGILLGGSVAFGVTRWLGYPILEIILPQTRLDRFTFFINSPRVELITFFLFLLPGMPKDILTDVAGLTPIRPLTFLIIASLARLPGIVISSYIGAGIERYHYGQTALIAGITALLLLLGWIYKERILAPFKGHD